MRCLFCKQDSSRSSSVEHILPESLGNKSHTLPPGVVCDRCNNYFSHSVEKPFLDGPAIQTLRFWQRLESKKGRIPPIDGLILPHIPVTATLELKSDTLCVDVPANHVDLVRSGYATRLLLPTTGPMSAAYVVSRFLAKVALEAMAACVCAVPGGANYLVDEEQLDPIRDHARRGKYTVWPVHLREIYRVNASVCEADGTHGQLLHE